MFVVLSGVLKGYMLRVGSLLQQSHWPVLDGTMLVAAHPSSLFRSPCRVGLHHGHFWTFSRISIQAHPSSPEPRHGILAQPCSPRALSLVPSDSSVVDRRWRISMARRRKKDRSRRPRARPRGLVRLKPRRRPVEWPSLTVIAAPLLLVVTGPWVVGGASSSRPITVF